MFFAERLPIIIITSQGNADGNAYEREALFMNFLNISGNLIRLRHEKKVTQEQVADFIGVTKASVSKWETGQSTPDIMLLPQLAAYFDVSVDALLGYEPQLIKSFRRDLRNSRWQRCWKRQKNW